MKSGMVDACTGVGLLSPILATASRIHSESAGVSASHARSFELRDASGLSDFAGAITFGSMVFLHYRADLLHLHTPLSPPQIFYLRVMP